MMTAINIIQVNQAYLYWFDIIAVIVILSGLWYGFKHGLSGELLPLLQWLIGLVVCSLYYQDIGARFAQFATVTRSFGDIFVYVSMFILICSLFLFIKEHMGEKPFSSELFGRFEKPAGIVAGGLRSYCYLILFMSIINTFEAASIQENGSTTTTRDGAKYSNNTTMLSEMQSQVMKRSHVGKFTGQYLSTLLMAPNTSDQPVKKAFKFKK